MKDRQILLSRRFSLLVVPTNGRVPQTNTPELSLRMVLAKSCSLGTHMAHGGTGDTWGHSWDTWGGGEGVPK